MFTLIFPLYMIRRAHAHLHQASKRLTSEAVRLSAMSRAGFLAPARVQSPDYRRETKVVSGFSLVDDSLYSVSFLRRILPLCIFNMCIQNCIKMQELLPTAKSVILTMCKKNKERRKKWQKEKQVKTQNLLGWKY